MKNILAAVDFSDATEPVAACAAAIARAFDAALTLVHVEPPEPDFVGYKTGPQHVRDRLAETILEHRERLKQLQHRLEQEGVRAHSRAVQGPTVEKLLSEVQHLDADLIVMGSHGHGALLHLLLGSVSEGVIKQAGCPVLVVPIRAAGAPSEQAGS